MVKMVIVGNVIISVFSLLFCFVSFDVVIMIVVVIKYLVIS